MNRYTAIFASIALCVVVLIAGCRPATPKVASGKVAAQATPTKVTKENFEMIHKGMPLENVIEILGPGEQRRTKAAVRRMTTAIPARNKNGATSNTRPSPKKN